MSEESPGIMIFGLPAMTSDYHYFKQMPKFDPPPPPPYLYDREAADAKESEDSRVNDE